MSRCSNCKSIWLIAKYNLMRNFSNPRVYILFTLLFIFLWYLLNPLSDVSREANLKISPWIYPHLSSDAIGKLFMMFGLIVFFLDAPFADSNYNFIILRSGRKTWIKAQILYIILGTIIYFLVIYAISLLILLPNMFFTTSWGKLMENLSLTSMGNASVLGISNSIINLYTPIKATLMSLSLDVILGISITLILFTFSMLNKKSIGITCISIVILMDTAMTSLSYNRMLMSKVSPLSMSRLDALEPRDISGYATISHAYTFLMILLLVVLIFTYNYCKRIYIEKVQQM